MRQRLRVVACVAAIIAMLASAPGASAQAPAPKVTIQGLVDNLYNWNRNMNMTHGGFDSTRTDQDSGEAYGRTRGRFDFIGEVGKAKGVLGLEFDLIYGATLASGADNPTGRPDGTSGGFDADNDVRNALELRWMYVEAPLTGPGSLIPFIPIAGMARFGGQPYTITYKPQIFASSDFGGTHVDLVFAPNVKGSLTYVQHEEKLTGGPSFADEDIGFILTTEVSPFKGLDIKPIYSYQEIGSVASANVRRGTGGIPDDTTNFPRGTTETRNTIGVDARWRSGPWSLSPTFFYQFGEVETRNPAFGSREADISAWILDVEAGYRIGPLLLEGRGVITSGNEANDDLRSEINYYQPFQTGNAYWFGWGEAVGIGSIDYLTSLNSFSNALSLPAQPSYDRYGRIMFAVRGTYSITPALRAYGIVTPMWSFEEVDTNGTATSAAGITPAADQAGDDRYLGTGLTAGLTYSFAPNLRFDAVYGVLFAGDGLGLEGREPKDSYVATARVRYTF